MIVNFNLNEYFKVILSQVFYITLLAIIITIEYKKGVKKVNVNGG